MSHMREWFQEGPEQTDTLKEGVSFIPIEAVEKTLDYLDSWGTQNFHYSFFRDAYGVVMIGASIELVVEYIDDDRAVKRTLVGACNFDISSIHPNRHYIATAKSECVKNAASDLGLKFGRSLNKGIVPNQESTSEANGGINIAASIDEIKPEFYAK
jgi:hypothetical protein